MLLAVAALITGADAAHLHVTSLFADGVVIQTSDEGGAGGRLTGLASPSAAVTLHGLPAAAAGAPRAVAAADGRFSPGLATRGLPGVPQDPFAPRRGPLGSSNIIYII
jgi:hypothetical protein